MGNKFEYEGLTGTHQWYDGTQHPWEFKRVWHLEPSLGDPDIVYAGAEDASLFRTTDGGQTWQELAGLPGAMSVDTLDSCGVYFGTTGGQVYGSADAGDNWEPIVRDLPAVLSVEAQTLP